MFNPADHKKILVRKEMSFIDNNNFLVENFDTYEGEKEKKSLQYKISSKGVGYAHTLEGFLKDGEL